MTDDDLDLATLPDDELVEQMHDDLYDGMAEEIDQGTRILLDRGWSPQRTLNEALIKQKARAIRERISRSLVGNQ